MNNKLSMKDCMQFNNEQKNNNNNYNEGKKFDACVIVFEIIKTCNNYCSMVKIKGDCTYISHTLYVFPPRLLLILRIC